MENISYVRVGDADGEQITIYLDGNTHVVDNGHPNYERISSALSERDYAALPSLLENVTYRILNQLGNRVVIEGNMLYFDNEPLYNKLTSTILDFHRQDRPFTRLVRFLEKIMANPSRNSREQLYEFLERNNFQITEDGDFIAYKGLSQDMRSINSGPGVVNGVEEEGHLDNSVGNVVELERRQVIDDPNMACSFGLHVGDYSYAVSFGSRLVEVLVNPADVVSVPNDSYFRKVRTCRYQVLREIPANISRRSFDDSVAYRAEDQFSTWLRRLATPYASYQRVAANFTELAERFLEGVEGESEDFSNAVRSMASRLDRGLTGEVTAARIQEVITEDDYSVEETDDVWDSEDAWEQEWDEEDDDDDWEDEDEDDDYPITEEFLDWLEDERTSYTRKGRMANSFADLAMRFLDDSHDATYSGSDLERFAKELDNRHSAGKVYAYHVDALLADNNRRLPN